MSFAIYGAIKQCRVSIHTLIDFTGFAVISIIIRNNFDRYESDDKSSADWKQSAYESDISTIRSLQSTYMCTA